MVSVVNPWTYYVPSLIPRRSIIVVSILSTISTLVMKGNAVLVILWPCHTRATRQGFVHLRLRTRAASKIRVTTNGRKADGRGSKIMVREWWQRRNTTTMTMIGSGTISATQALMA